MDSILSGCCQDCGGRCLLRFYVEKGKVVKIETDDTEEPQLRACARGRAYRQKIYDSDRVLYPLKRVGARGEGRFERISWDEAFDIVSSELKRVKTSYGPESVYYLSESGFGAAVLQHPTAIARVLNLFGGFTPTWGGSSAESSVFANRATYGTLATGHSREDHLNSKLLILWGWNPLETIQSTLTPYYLIQAKDKGIRFVCVDPRFTNTCAKLADEWVPIRPGTDTAMLVAMANVIISNGLEDKSFLATSTVGFEEFKDYVLGPGDGVAKTPEWAEPITGVPAGTIRRLAVEYATLKPGALIPGYGPGRTAFGEQFHRATAVLAAITGNIGIRGGGGAGFERAPVGSMIGPTIPEGKNPVQARHEYVRDSLLRGVPRPGTIYRQKSWDAILKGREGGYPADIKLMYIAFCNALNSHADINKGIAALKKLEFLVVQDTVFTATARYADIILPTNTSAERNDILRPWTSGPYYIYNRKVIESAGESRTDFEIASGLASRLGLNYGDKNQEEWLDSLAATSEDLKTIPDYPGFKGRGYYKMHLGEPVVPFIEQRLDPVRHPYPTPSGKIEIYSERLAKLNNPQIPPVPKYIEPWEGPGDPLAGKYPLQLITPHFWRRAHSIFDRAPWLSELEPQSVWINPADAAARDIRNGEKVKVWNDRGVIVVSARVTERIMPGVVSVPEGAWYEPDRDGVDRGGCANVLTRDDYSPGGAFATNTALVQVAKA